MKGDFTALQNNKLLQTNQEDVKGIGNGLFSIYNNDKLNGKTERGKKGGRS
jgi:hypothetical protein